MTRQEASECYDILVMCAGATEYWRENFVELQSAAASPKEFRFQGSLGFGGKFWRRDDPPTYDVTCYREDETPARRATILATNEALRSWAARRASTSNDRPSSAEGPKGS